MGNLSEWGSRRLGLPWGEVYKAGRGHRPYHAELGLQLNLQVLHGAAELRDLGPAALQGLGVSGHLPVQLLRLEDRGPWCLGEACAGRTENSSCP